MLDQLDPLRGTERRCSRCGGTFRRGQGSWAKGEWTCHECVRAQLESRPLKADRRHKLYIQMLARLYRRYPEYCAGYVTKLTGERRVVGARQARLLRVMQARYVQLKAREPGIKELVRWLGVDPAEVVALAEGYPAQR